MAPTSLRHGAGLLAGLCVAACARSDTIEPAPPVYASTGVEARAFAVHPLHNPRRLDAIFGPLITRLERKTGERFRLEASRNYAAFEHKLELKQVDFALPNPYQVIKARASGFRVFAKMGDDERFHGLILVRKDHNISSLTQLRGKRIAFPAPTALAATLMPQFLLGEAGLLPGRDYEPIFVGSQDSSIMTVYGGEVEAAATWPPPWEALSTDRPEVGAALEVLASTSPLVNNGVVVREGVPQPLVDAVQRELITLANDDEGRAILKRMELSRFEAATEETYEPVRRFLAHYTEHIGPLP